MTCYQIHSIFGGATRTIEVCVPDNMNMDVDGSTVTFGDVTIDIQEVLIGIDKMPDSSDEDPVVVFP